VLGQLSDDIVLLTILKAQLEAAVSTLACQAEDQHQHPHQQQQQQQQQQQLLPQDVPYDVPQLNSDGILNETKSLPQHVALYGLHTVEGGDLRREQAQDGLSTTLHHDPSDAAGI
jgi:hypothetical protein